MGMTTTSTLLVQDGTALWERLLYNELHKGYGRWLDSLFKLSVKMYLNGKQKHFKVIIASTPLYIISLYFCCHVIQCLRHVTISLLLGSLIFCVGYTCVGVYMEVPVYLYLGCTVQPHVVTEYVWRSLCCSSRSTFIAFQGLPIILICWNVNSSTQCSTIAASSFLCLGFFF